MAESDNLYFRILGELYRHPSLRESRRDSFAGLADNLGVDDQTVRNALKRMHQSGFLKGWSVSLNPQTLGMECASVFIKENRTSSLPKQKMLSQLKLLEGIVLIMSFLDGTGFRLVFYYKDEADLEAKVRLVSSICGVEKPQYLWKIPFPRCSTGLKKTDWKIMKLLFEDARMSLSEMAERIGASSRTVRRRIASLVENSAFFTNPVVDVKKIEGFVYLFVVVYGDKKAKLVVDAELRDSVERVIFLDTNADFYTVVASVCRNIAAADRISARLKAQDGVERVIVRITDDLISVNDWINNEIDRRVKT